MSLCAGSLLHVRRSILHSDLDGSISSKKSEYIRFKMHCLESIFWIIFGTYFQNQSRQLLILKNFMSHLIIHTILIPFITIIDKLFALNFAKIRLKHRTLILFYKQRFISNTKYVKTSWTVAYKTEWVYLTIICSYRKKKSEFAHVEKGGPKFMFSLLGRVFLMWKTTILSSIK